MLPGFEGRTPPSARQVSKLTVYTSRGQLKKANDIVL